MADDGVVDRVVTSEGCELVLHHRQGVYTVRIDGLEVISSRGRGSEEELARLACAGLEDIEEPRVVVAGLGMGYTLRATLDLLPADAEATVVELFPVVVEWNRGPIAPLAGAPLEDPRVRLMVGDIYELLNRSPGRFDRILLDVDNGPAALAVRTNRRLYEAEGIRRIGYALRTAGIVAVWAADDDPAFRRRLRDQGFVVETVPVRVESVVHTVYLARRQSARC